MFYYPNLMVTLSVIIVMLSICSLYEEITRLAETTGSKYLKSNQTHEITIN